MQLAAFENYEIEKMRDGHVVVSTKVVESSLNYYGNAHGGYLFTLCDQVSGLVVVSQGVDGVTLQSSINYLKAGRLGDVLTIHGECVHSGRTTRVVDVDITNQDGANVCKATFTMFVTGGEMSPHKYAFKNYIFDFYGTLSLRSKPMSQVQSYGIPWLYQSYGVSYTGEGLRLRYRELVQQAEQSIAKEKRCLS